MPQPLTLLSFELGGRGDSGRRQAAWSTPGEELEGSDLCCSHCPVKQSFHVYPRLGVCEGGPHGCKAQQETQEAVTFSSQPLNCWARDIGSPPTQRGLGDPSRAEDDPAAEVGACAFSCACACEPELESA